MRREDKFVLSHRPYAVDPTSLIAKFRQRDGKPEGDGYWDCRIGAVWFRRKAGVTSACVGYLWDIQHAEPDVAEFLERHDDGRYGGTCTGRWDGENYWGEQNPDKIAADLKLLRPMLERFPEVPFGYDGWWTFREVTP